ncbi:hypothetical protein R3Q06_22965 [Rhodococcus erythropolis]|uniref:hypothetical protein n=1 Tax=Rhodococcus erythropolis TaxID=1833 RepID=UPI002949A4FF|nr:hypothetical protein [Rhodococcus erythropolis]MDV6276364.1 hypothetical protein [Rhodococcus erythropolis]
MEKLPRGKPRDQDIWSTFKSNWFSNIFSGFANIGQMLGDLANAFLGGGSFGPGPLKSIKDRSVAVSADLAGLQSRTQQLEGVIGYAHSYCTGGAPVGNADTFIPLNIPVGPTVGVTRTGNRFVLGSRGLWVAQAQIGYDSISSILNTYINAQIRIYTPGGTLFAHGIAETVTETQHTCTVQMPFVVPAAGYYAELWGFMGLTRGIKGGSSWTRMSVQKVSSETS